MTAQKSSAVLQLNLIFVVYMQPSLIADFLLANLLINIGKIGQNANYLVKHVLFVVEFNIRGQKWWIVSTLNNKGNLDTKLSTFF